MSQPRQSESSLDRVTRVAGEMGLAITPQIMPDSTRTAQDAANACDCDVAQIVKSIIFERADTSELVLVLVSGQHNADMKKLAEHFGTELNRADPRKVREVTGFAIGGVSPIGHLIAIETVMDKTLLDYDIVWAAAGKPNAVFSVKPEALKNALVCAVIEV